MKIVPGSTYHSATISPGHKDAFHVAAVLCRKSSASKYNIDPGERVRFVGDSEVAWYDEDEGDWDGIADPFAPAIGKESLFWVFLRPGRYTDVTHSFRLNLPEESNEENDGGQDYDWNAGCRKCDS